MPNWTSNNVLFAGKEKQLKTLQTMLQSNDNDFVFNNIIPMPEELKDTVAGSENAKPEWQKEQSKGHPLDVIIEAYLRTSPSLKWPP